MLGEREVVRRVAATLRTSRHDQGLSLGEVAGRAGMSRTTLRNLEQGDTNPTLETVIAVVGALGLRLDEVFTSRNVTADRAPTVVRRGDGPVATCAARTLRHVASLRISGRVEIYSGNYEAGVLRRSTGHASGTTEHLYVVRGHLEVGPDEHLVRLGKGDYARFVADTAHSYQAIGGPAEVVLIVERPG